MKKFLAAIFGGIFLCGCAQISGNILNKSEAEIAAIFATAAENDDAKKCAKIFAKNEIEVNNWNYEKFAFLQQFFFEKNAPNCFAKLLKKNNFFQKIGFWRDDNFLERHFLKLEKSAQKKWLEILTAEKFDEKFWAGMADIFLQKNKFANFNFLVEKKLFNLKNFFREFRFCESSDGRDDDRKLIFFNFIFAPPEFLADFLEKHKNEINVNFTNKNNETILFFAVAAKKLEIVKILVENGARILKKDRNGATPLDIARQKNFVEIVKFLEKSAAKNLEKNAEKFKKLEKINAEILADEKIFENDNLEKFKKLATEFFLISENEIENFATKKFFARAIENDARKIANFLVDHFFQNWNARGGIDEIFVKLETEKQINFLEFFVKKELPENLTFARWSENKQKFFHKIWNAAIKNRDAEIAGFFLINGIRDFKKFFENDPDLIFKILENPAFVKNLATAKINLNSQNRRGESLLFFAVARRNFLAVKNLVENGAQIFPDKNGATPLDIARAENFPEIVNFLEKAKNFKKISAEKFGFSFWVPRFFEQKIKDENFTFQKNCDDEKNCPKFFLSEIFAQKNKRFSPEFEKKIGEINFFIQKKENQNSFLFEKNNRFFQFDFYNFAADEILASIEFFDENPCAKIPPKIVVPPNFSEKMEIEFCGENENFYLENARIFPDKILQKSEKIRSIFVPSIFLADGKKFKIGNFSREIENLNSQNFFDFKNLFAVHFSENFGAIAEIFDEKKCESEFWQIWQNEKTKIFAEKKFCAIGGPNFKNLEIRGEKLLTEKIEWSLKNREIIRKIDGQNLFFKNEKFIFAPILDDEKNFILDFSINGKPADLLQKPFFRDLKFARENCAENFRNEDPAANFELFFDDEKLFLELRDVQNSGRAATTRNPECPKIGKSEKIEIKLDENFFEKFRAKTANQKFLKIEKCATPPKILTNFLSDKKKCGGEFCARDVQKFLEFCGEKIATKKFLKTKNAIIFEIENFDKTAEKNFFELRKISTVAPFEQKILTKNLFPIFWREIVKNENFAIGIFYFFDEKNGLDFLFILGDGPFSFLIFDSKNDEFLIAAEIWFRKHFFKNSRAEIFKKIFYESFQKINSIAINGKIFAPHEKNNFLNLHFEPSFFHTNYFQNPEKMQKIFDIFAENFPKKFPIFVENYEKNILEFRGFFDLQQKIFEKKEPIFLEK